MQEAQLDQHMKPNDSQYGIEPEGCEGQLTLMGLNNETTIEKVASHRGNYINLFEAVYHTIANGALYPITDEHIAWQVELLEA